MRLVLTVSLVLFGTATVAQAGMPSHHHHGSAMTMKPARPAGDCPTRTGSGGTPWSALRVKGRRPAAGATVTIGARRTVRLNVNARVRGLRVRGRLVLDDRADRQLTARWIVVEPGGTLCVGSARRPFRHRATITLRGTPGPDDVAGMGSKILAVGGRLELHGARRADVDWTRLAATAQPGDQRLVLERAVGWRPGDHLVLASSAFDPHQAEEVVVRRATGAAVELEQPLRYRHWGTLQQYGGIALDERAEVGLLTRNVVIEGDAASDASQFGAQVMVGAGGVAHVEGVEIRRAGQAGLKARYPFHWHMAGDVRGQYLRDSSVHDAFNRFVTIHGTQNALVQRVVGYDTLGHGFFLEDGVETGNRFLDVLGVLVRRPARRIIPSDNQPAVFWLANPSNEVRGSVAAGSEGQGFWFDLPERPTGLSEGAPGQPRAAAMGAFTDNVAHSTVDTAEVADNGNGLIVENHQGPRATIAGFTAYMNQWAGVWGGNLALSAARIADNTYGVLVFDPKLMGLDDSLVVGRSAAAPEGPPWRAWADQPVDAIQLYDGNIASRGTTFAGFREFPGANGTRRPSGVIGFLENKSTTGAPGSSFTDSRLLDSNVVGFKPFYEAGPAGRVETRRTMLFRDLDGSLTGRAGPSAIVYRNPLQMTAACTPLDARTASCPGAQPYGQLVVGPLATTDIRYRRADGAVNDVGIPAGAGAVVNAHILLDTDYEVEPAKPLGEPTYVDLVTVGAGDWVRASLPWAHPRAVVRRDGRPLPMVATRAALDDQRGPAAAWFDPVGGRLVVQLRATPETLDASPLRPGEYYVRVTACSAATC